jgi:hypothetical protein
MLRRAFLTVALAVAALALAGAADAATYYVSPSGSDSAGGTSAAAAWQTVARVNRAALGPGDTVLFQGGSTFAGLLQPAGSGSSTAPIAFGSYGGGRADLSGGIALASQSWLVFDGLAVDTGGWQTAGSTRGITTSSSGSGVQHVVVRNSAFQNVALGLLLQNHLDTAWTVSSSTIRWTRDSGILIYDPSQPNEVGGGPMTFDGNQILDTGLDTSLAYKKHGVYDIGHDITWTDNTVARFSEGGFSVRARGNTFLHNTVSDGPYAFYYSPYDPTAGTTTLAYNTISNVTQGSITVDSSGEVANPESFRILDNTISAAGSAPGIRVLGTSGSVAIANNLVVTAGGPPLRVDTRPGGGISERNDLFWSTGGPVALGWLGTTVTTVAGLVAAGAGSGDVIANPLLDGSLAPAAASPAVDAGTTAPGGYVADCTTQPFHYCGSSPDLGSTELGASASAPAPQPLAPPTAVVAQSATQTGIVAAWTGSADARTTGYRVSLGGTAVGSTAGKQLSIGGLACGTTYAVSVVATDAAGDVSAAAAASLSTAACPPPAIAPTLTINVANGQTIPTTFRITATATGTPVRNVTFWFDGNTPCVVSTAPYVSCQIRASEGGHTLRVRATAVNGLYTEATVHVWCDPSRTTLGAATTVVHGKREAAAKRK